MQSLTLILLAAIVAMAAAAGQYYVPRAYYIIDSEGHESAPVPLRRLRRSLSPYPHLRGASAHAVGSSHVENKSWGESSGNTVTNSRLKSGSGGWTLPLGLHGSSDPKALMQ